MYEDTNWWSLRVPGKCEEWMCWSCEGHVAHSRVPNFSLDRWWWPERTHTGLPVSGVWMSQYWQSIQTHLLRMMRMTDPSGLMKAVCSKSVCWLVDTPSLWEPSHRNLLNRKKGSVLPEFLIDRTNDMSCNESLHLFTKDPVCYLKWAML